MDTKGGIPRWGGDGGVMNWVIGIDMYTLMCMKLTNKNLQCKKTNKQTKRKYTKILIMIISGVIQLGMSLSSHSLLRF